MNLQPEIKVYVSIILVFVLSIFAFHNSYFGDFVFDDLEAVVNNKDVSRSVDSQSLYELFQHDFWGSNLTSKTSHKSYRPLTVLTFWYVFSLVLLCFVAIC
jgi:protein O-mannosyl-transferase